MKALIIVTAIAVLASACTVSVSEQGVANIPGEEVWKTDLELEVGQVAYVGERELEITLRSVGVDEATVLLKSDAGLQERTIRMGAGGDVFLRPYTIRLLSTTPEQNAVIQVRREWGRPR